MWVKIIHELIYYTGIVEDIRLLRQEKVVSFFRKASQMKNPQSIRGLFAVPGFVAASKLVGVFGDRYARVFELRRRKKQLYARIVGIAAKGVMINECSGSGIFRWPDGGSTWSLSAGESTARGAAACM